MRSIVRSAPLALLALLALSPRPLGAQLTPDEFVCQYKATRVAWKFFYGKMKCVAACEKGVFAGSTPAADCVPPYDHATAGCVNEQEGKATGGVCKVCSNDTPECYVGSNCPAVADTIVAGVEAQLDALVPQAFCDDSGSGDGLSPREFKCAYVAFAYVAKFAYRKAVCLTRCRGYEFKGAIPAGSCTAGAVTDPTGRTQACISKLELKAAARIDRYCDAALGGDAPECWTTTTGAGWTALGEAAVDSQDPTLFCSD